MEEINLPVSFFFNINFLGEKITKNGFQSITGLSVDIETETLKEGGENRFTHVLPVSTKYDPLILKRGLVKDPEMVKWTKDAILHFDIRPMDLIVNLLTYRRNNNQSQTSVPLMTWKVINAWPKKWSMSEFNAEQSSLAIESLELNYSYFEAMQ